MGDKNRVNYDKINEIRRNTGFVERWKLNLTIGDLQDVRTGDGRVYTSKLEFWNDRRKDISEVFTSSCKLYYPPILSDILNISSQMILLPFSFIVGLPEVYKNLKYSEEKQGYILKNIEHLMEEI